MVIDDGSDNLRCLIRTHKPNPKYASMAQTVNWSCEDVELAEASTLEVHPIVLPASTDALSWEPAPKMIHDILKLPEGQYALGG
jgi:hypothetical protein